MISGARVSSASSAARVIFSPTTTPMLPPMNEYSIAATTTGTSSSMPLPMSTASFTPPTWIAVLSRSL